MSATMRLAKLQLERLHPCAGLGPWQGAAPGAERRALGEGLGRARCPVEAHGAKEGGFVEVRQGGGL
ncbi:MAG: hypothetical protein ACPF9T_03665, partial [Pseudomonadales bacterium]